MAMTSKDKDIILGLIKRNTRTSIGRISQKELRPNHLVASIFTTFEVSSIKDPKASAVANRVKMQELINDNTIPYSGRCRYPTLCIDEFLRDIDAKFKLKQRKTPMQGLKKGAMSVVAIIILLFSGCSSDEEPTKDQIDQQLIEEIMQVGRDNSLIQANLPILENSADTLMRLLNSTNDEYTQNILIMDIQEILASIDKAKAAFSENTYRIAQQKRKLIQLRRSQKELVPLISPDSVGYDVIGKDTISYESITITPTL